MSGQTKGEDTMHQSRMLRLGVILGMVAASAVMLASTAGAGRVDRFTIHVERTFDLEDFCDVEGLTVTIARTVDIRVHIVSHGSAGLEYFLQHGSSKEVLTNGDTSLTSIATVNEKDLRVTDNGDGTVTVLIIATGNAVLYGEDGKAIARNPGQTRFEILVDHAGTPTDPSDDEFLEFLGVVKESTGRTDDFCEAAVPALT